MAVPNSVTAERPRRAVYVLRLASDHGDDIRKLRWALKGLLRRLGLRCLSIEVENEVPR